MENDNALLSKAESMSNGGIWEKILAVNLLMDHFRTLPREKGEELLIKLARKNQPMYVRFHIIIRLLKGTNIDNHTSVVIVDTLWNGLGLNVGPNHELNVNSSFFSNFYPRSKPASLTLSKHYLVIARDTASKIE